MREEKPRRVGPERGKRARALAKRETRRGLVAFYFRVFLPPEKGKISFSLVRRCAHFPHGASPTAFVTFATTSPTPRILPASYALHRVILRREIGRRSALLAFEHHTALMVAVVPVAVHPKAALLDQNERVSLIERQSGASGPRSIFHRCLSSTLEPTEFPKYSSSITSR